MSKSHLQPGGFFFFFPSFTQLSTHSSPEAFQSAGCPRRLPRRRSEAFCDWAIGGSTTAYLGKQSRGF